MSWAYRSTVSLRLVCSSDRAYRRMRTTHSSTASLEMPHMARYCAAGGKSFIDRSSPCCNREFAELVVSQPELLAHHCSEAGMIAEAIEYYLLAAQRATAASNNAEKIAHITRGLTLVEQLPSSDQRTAEFRIRLTLAGALSLW